MYTLYSRPGSGGFVVEVALTMAGAPYEIVRVEKASPPAGYEKLSPLRQVPALTLPDGRTITESAAICLLLQETYPQVGIGPAAGTQDRPEFLRWMFFLSSMLYPTLMRFFFCERSTTDARGLEAVKQAAIVEADRGFQVVDEALSGRDWLAGGQKSIADVYLAMLAHWHPVADRPRDEWTNIVRVCEVLKRDPLVAKLNEVHRFW
ncbi:glutathione S-transferase family protein [Mesorhizobium sp. LHD-90]|uniref:glutathione S-transferase family protein n=1 Tax=Mesorhizobium sp. LHD-90 TaxID=3071414 RepID=UPI0027E16AF7|nr:glutathione S-transferase family protein [Mesorhizobium sp. LHD-90]MDQ6433327.1 glutathione S-transferase family protein [Mesorhizobium sp. LHD-90]